MDNPIVNIPIIPVIPDTIISSNSPKNINIKKTDTLSKNHTKYIDAATVINNEKTITVNNAISATKERKSAI